MDYTKLAEVMGRQTEVNQEILKALKSADGVTNNTPLHGIGGLFNTPGMERDVITAHIRPKGLASQLPLLASVTEDPRFGAVTGYTASIGDRTTVPCEDAPYNYIKACTLTARFGLTRHDTKEIDIGTVMKKVNRGDMTDLILRGRILGLSGLTPDGLNDKQILSIVTMSEMVGAAVGAERELAVDMWQGVFGTGAFTGLDSQIVTGIVDSETGVACSALDSDVKDFGYDDVAGGGRSIVTYVTMMETYLRHNAIRMGHDTVSYVIVMRAELWQELSEVWPCQYNTNRCAQATIGNSSQTVIMGKEMVAMRDSMRNSMTIAVNGRTFPVVTDDGIFEANNINNGNLEAGQYASSLYFVPLTLGDGFTATYREYLNYSAWDTDASLLRGKEDFWTDGGLWSWSITQEKWCYMLHLRSEQRVVLRTPHLAGKIQNIMYEPLQHLRDFNPDSPYWEDGGVSTPRTADDWNAVWK